MLRGHTVGIGALLAGGREMEIEDEVPVEPFEGISFENPAHLRLMVRYAQGWLELRGSVTGHASAPCDVCLEPVSFDVRANIDERLNPFGGEREPFEEENVLAGDRLDVGDLARQVLLSTLPMGVRCEQHAL
jgi:uncharacterized metal-binding protein YceD (DUF177 family)